MANSVSILYQLSNFFFSIISWGWWIIFPVVFLGIACIPIRISLRHF